MMVDCSWLLLTNPDAAQPQSLNPTTIADGLHPSAAGVGGGWVSGWMGG